MARRTWTLLRKTPPTGIVEGMLDLRERSKAMLTQHGLLGFAAAVAAKLAWFVVLEVALWCVGIGPDVLPPSAVLAAMAVVGIVSLVPITPGAVGVAEVAYIGILSSVAGSGMTEQLTAAVMLFRIAQWLVPIPIGWVLLHRAAAGPLGGAARGLTRLRRRPRAGSVRTRAARSARQRRGAAPVRSRPLPACHPRATMAAWAVPRRRSPSVPLASWHEARCTRACLRECPRG